MDRIGRYEIIEQVGRGSMGVVYRAQDTVLEREVALKLLWEDFCDDESALARFQREARAVARLTHRNIVTLYELGQQEDGRPYIAMEFLRGQPLDKRLRSEPALTLLEHIDIVAQLCAGLHFAHEQGVVHRDVKPANIWVQPDGSVKLLDFGIARLASSSITRDGNVVGTAYYMAPEQIEGGNVDGRTDVFAAGVVLFELVAGHRPFEAESPTGVIAKIVRGDRKQLEPERDHLPPALVTAIDRALARSPADRYATASEFGATLAAIRSALDRHTSMLPIDVTMLLPGSSPPTAPAVPHAVEAAEGDLLIARAPATPVADLALQPHTAQAAAPVAAPAGPTAANMPLSRPPAPSRGPSPRRRSWTAVAGTVAAVLVLGLVALGVRMLGRQPDAPLANVTPGVTPAAAIAPGEQGAAAPEAADARSLRIESDPEGAEVTVNGRHVEGVTPLTVTWTAGGAEPRDVRLEKQGFDGARLVPTAEQLGAGTLRVALRPSLERVRVTASGEYPFEIVDGSRTISPAARQHSINVPAGRQLRLRSSAYRLDQRVTVGGTGGTMRVAVPGAGSISVRAVIENCEMRIDGFPAEPPPVHRKPLSAGDHLIDLICGDGEPRRQRVQVSEGANATVLFRQ